MLSDGAYDVMVVDTRPAADDGSCVLELVISAGEVKGEVMELRVHGLDIDPVELLGLPGVVEVDGGVPRFQLS